MISLTLLGVNLLRRPAIDRLTMGLKVIGAGFGRTGTSSLKLALEELGYRKCYHMDELYQHPEHRFEFEKAASGGIPNWDNVYEGYEAAVDFPTCSFYKELMVKYPYAKVLLSVRDSKEWYESAYQTIWRSSRMNSDDLDPIFKLVGPMIDKIIWNGAFQGRFSDKEHTIKVYEERIEEVKRSVPKEKLLVYNINEGWQPLCEFLGAEVPGKRFPHANDRITFNSKTSVKS